MQSLPKNMQTPFSMSRIPSKPGCYIFTDKQDRIIYIGKAKNLKKRVTSYFSKQHKELKTKQLVEHIHNCEVIITPNEVEALLLESSLIRQHKPKYNIDLKYGVRYAWIVLTNEQFPRLITARNRGLDGEYFGPFVSGQLRRVLIDTLQKKFFIRTCHTFPKKACLRYHINLCKAPCIKAQNKEEYIQNIELVRAYLQGKNKELIKNLEKEMKSHSKKEQFEVAKLIKEQIDALRFLQERILIENTRLEEQDVIQYLIERKKNKDYVKLMIFSFRHGVLHDKEEFTIAHEEEFLESFLKRYYEVAPAPQEIIIPQELSDKNIEAYLGKLANYKVKIVVPQRGMKKELLELVAQNLVAKQTEAEQLAKELQTNLQLYYPIRTIECFDISHHSGTSMVGAMVHFKDGKPLKSKYRKFKIQTVEGVDDFRAIKEVVYRRYKRLIESKQELPQLILIDGGEIQVEFAGKALQELGIYIPYVGLAKREEEIYFPNKKIAQQFSKKSLMMRTLIQARDEAHRFGITYHRLLKKKKTFSD